MAEKAEYTEQEGHLCMGNQLPVYLSTKSEKY